MYVNVVCACFCFDLLSTLIDLRACTQVEGWDFDLFLRDLDWDAARAEAREPARPAGANAGGAGGTAAQPYQPQRPSQQTLLLLDRARRAAVESGAAWHGVPAAARAPEVARIEAEMLAKLGKSRVPASGLE